MLSPASLEQLISTYIYGIPAGEKHWFKRSLICSGGRGSMWVYFLKLCELVGQSQVGKIGSFENGEDWQCRQDCPAAGASDFAFALFGSVALQK